MWNVSVLSPDHYLSIYLDQRERERERERERIIKNQKYTDKDRNFETSFMLFMQKQRAI